MNNCKNISASNRSKIRILQPAPEKRYSWEKKRECILRTKYCGAVLNNCASVNDYVRNLDRIDPIPRNFEKGLFIATFRSRKWTK